MTWRWIAPHQRVDRPRPAHAVSAEGVALCPAAPRDGEAWSEPPEGTRQCGRCSRALEHAAGGVAPHLRPTDKPPWLARLELQWAEDATWVRGVLVIDDNEGDQESD